MSHNFDSFNAEDSHTVHNGIIDNPNPHLTNSSHAHACISLLATSLASTDDHVDHRVGPDNPTMVAKQQMNDVLKRVVDVLDQGTLLVIFGDHGMDCKDNRNGDLDIPTDFWIYSKGSAFAAKDVPTSHLPHKPSLGINACQVYAYFDTYRNGPSGGGLDDVSRDFEGTSDAVQRQ